MALPDDAEPSRASMDGDFSDATEEAEGSRLPSRARRTLDQIAEVLGVAVAVLGRPRWAGWPA